MSISPLDLERLASRIERLQRTRTHDWMPGDGMEFKRQLPSDRVLHRDQLPAPAFLRATAKGEGEKEFTVQEYRTAIQRCLRMESLISRNKPTSTARMMYDIKRGRPPGFRR